MKIVLMLLVLLASSTTLTPDKPGWPGGHVECFDVDMIQVDTVERTITLHISDEGMCQVRGEVELWNVLIREDEE